MPSSYSTNLRFELQFTGENVNTWGDRLNATFSRVDDSIAGYVAIALTGDYSLSSANSNTTADEARRAHLKFTGSSLTTTTVITIPAVSKSYWIWNATNKSLSFTTGSGSTVMVEAGDIQGIWCDGTNLKTTTYGGLALKDYVAAVTASAGAVPGVTGNAGKYLYTDGASAFWRQPSTSDLSDYRAAIVGIQVAMAVAL